MAATVGDTTRQRTRATPKPRRRSRLTLVRARNLVQAAFALFLLWSGWRFYLFVHHFETGGATPLVERPASVEAFLPISALVSLHAWLGVGFVDRTHPAAVVLLFAIMATSWLFKKSVCSWICPLGTLSEWLARVGKRLAGRNYVLPAVVDWPLRGIKYLVLFFFLYVTVIALTAEQSVEFLQTPYSKVADVKMLYFFLEMGAGVAAFLAVVTVASVFVSNFWCRYLCPYGAFVGLISLFSPLRIVRVTEKCIDCRLCTRACPNRIDVARLARVDSPECTSCLNCVAACPRRGALQIRPPRLRWSLDPWAYAVLLLGLFFLIVVSAQIAGYWQTDLSYADFARLVPQAELFSHLGY